MAIDFAEMAEHAAAMIRDWGSAAKLVRNGVERDCFAAVLDYNPRARGQAALQLEGAERALIAAPLAIPPDFEQDKLAHGGKLYQIPTPVKGPRPAGVVVFYDADVIYERAYP